MRATIYIRAGCAADLSIRMTDGSRGKSDPCQNIPLWLRKTTTHPEKPSSSSSRGAGPFYLARACTHTTHTHTRTYTHAHLYTHTHTYTFYSSLSSTSYLFLHFVNVCVCARLYLFDYLFYCSTYDSSGVFFFFYLYYLRAVILRRDNVSHRITQGPRYVYIRFQYKVFWGRVHSHTHIIIIIIYTI